MSDPAEADGQEPNAETPGQAPETTTAPEAAVTPTTPEDPKDGQEPKVFDEDYVKQLRNEAAQARKANKALEAQVTEFENAKLSAEEKATKERDEALSKAEAAQGQLRKANLLLALGKSDEVADAKAVAGLITGVEYDDEGEPTNLTERLAAAIESYPILRKGAAKLDPADPANPESRKRTPETQEQALARIHSGGGSDVFEGATVVLSSRSGVEPE